MTLTVNIETYSFCVSTHRPLYLSINIWMLSSAPDSQRQTLVDLRYVIVIAYDRDVTGRGEPGGGVGLAVLLQERQTMGQQRKSFNGKSDGPGGSSGHDRPHIYGGTTYSE